MFWGKPVCFGIKGGKVKVILPTCPCCETETWLSLLLEAGVGNVLEDLIVTPAKEGGGRRELQRYQDFRLVFKSKSNAFRSSIKKKKKKVRSSYQVCQCHKTLITRSLIPLMLWWIVSKRLACVWIMNVLQAQGQSQPGFESL